MSHLGVTDGGVAGNYAVLEKRTKKADTKHLCVPKIK